MTDHELTIGADDDGDEEPTTDTAPGEPADEEEGPEVVTDDKLKDGDDDDGT